MKWSELSLAQKIAGIAGVILIINLFLPWYRFSFGGFSASANAFDAGFLAWFGTVVAVAAAVLIVMPAFGKEVPKLGSLHGSQIALVLSALAVVLIVLRWVTETGSVYFGLFIGVLGAAAVGYASFTAMKDAGLEMPSADDFKSIAGGDDEAMSSDDE